jgi:type VI secretion system protein ImpH
VSRESVIGELVEKGRSFDFFQAVRLLERLGPGGEPVGQDAFPHEEVVRFVPWLSLAFPSSSIREVEQPDEPERWENAFRMLVNFMGLYGPQGVLPRHYTELLLEREQVGDRGLRDFLDIFNHRFISLFFRANEKYVYPSTCRADGGDPITEVVNSFLGEEKPGESSVDEALPRRHLLRYVGLFTQRPRSVKALEALATDYFGGVPVDVRQFVGRWVPLPQEDQGRLTDAGERNRLGRTLVMGARIWDRKGKFRLRIGPLEMNEYLDFLPDGRYFAPLAALVREFVGDHLAFEVQPVLRAGDVPELQLDSSREVPVRLGRTTWLRLNRCTADSEDAIFQPPAGF